ncbi:thioredoxin reductase [Obelidium mucronatum]|nr:thioredoxin reductase [Obelidium mucronatum]
MMATSLLRLRQHRHHYRKFTSTSLLGSTTSMSGGPKSSLFASLLFAAPFASKSISSTTTATKKDGSLAAPFDVVIIGSGPAAHTAAIYAARAQLQPVLYEGFMAGGVAAGGQLTTTTEVENFPGFPKGISGPDLTDLFRAQSAHHGTAIVTETIAGVDLSARPFKLFPEGGGGAAVHAQAVIVATGATAKRLFLAGEEAYWSRGISACAVCDGAAPLFRGQALAVVGGGDSAAAEALFLTRFASRVTVLVRGARLRASKVMAARLLSHPRVDVRFNAVPQEALGDGNALSGVAVRDAVTGATATVDAKGLFYAIGHVPNTAFLRDSPVALDADGYIVVEPGTSCTNVPGVFAAGDVQDKRYRQAITAAGSGCMAALDCERWLESNVKSH